MFANFFGIIIVSASVLLIAGLILRPAPDLPASMNLGIIKATSEVTQQAASVETPSTAADTSSESASTETTSTDTASTGTSETTDNDTSSETTGVETSETSKETKTEAKTAVKAISEATETITPAAQAMSDLEKRDRKNRRKAAEQSDFGAVRANKSDAER